MMVVMFAALIVGILVFGLPVRGALWLFAVAGACAALAGIGIGVMIATVSKSQQQAQLLTFFVNPPITLLSGSTSPIENMPDFFQKLSYLDPLRYLVTVVRGVTLKDAPWSALWPNLVVLAAFAIVSVLHQRVAIPKNLVRRRIKFMKKLARILERRETEAETEGIRKGTPSTAS